MLTTSEARFNSGLMLSFHSLWPGKLQTAGIDESVVPGCALSVTLWRTYQDRDVSFWFIFQIFDRTRCMCFAVSVCRRAQCRWYILHYTSEHADKRQRLHVGGHVQWTPSCRARQPGTVLHRTRWKTLPSHSHLPPPWQAATARHGSGRSGRGWVLPGDRVSGLVQEARFSGCGKPQSYTWTRRTPSTRQWCAHHKFAGGDCKAVHCW